MTDSPTGKSIESSSRSLYFKRYENDTDKYGFNPSAHKGVETCVRWVYKNWFGVQVAGIENIPADGKTILFGNHSGGIPVDGFLLYDGLINNHPKPRRIRFLVTKFVLNAPYVGKILRAYGCIPADFKIATSLLRKDDLVLFYPEAEAGTGKLYINRYKLADFHAGFVRAAISTGAPLVPAVTIGGDEIYPLIANFKFLAKLLDAPYFPVTLFFPWMPFPLNFIPIPIKIMVAVWPPFKLKYPPEAADDEKLVNEIAEDIRRDIQNKVNELLKIRTNPFAKWNMEKVNAYLKATKSYSPDMDKHRFQ